jgi:hypothetical protein
MAYTLCAIGCYIVMRALQVLFEEHLQKRWCKIVIKTVTVITLYVGLASVAGWYTGETIPFLGFNPQK